MIVSHRQIVNQGRGTGAERLTMLTMLTMK